MFTSLPRDLKSCILDFLCPPMWEGCIRDIIQWANNPAWVPFEHWQICTVFLDFTTPMEHSDIGFGWQIEGHVTLSRTPAISRNQPLRVSLSLTFKKQSGVGKPMFTTLETYDLDENNELHEQAYDLLSFCPREVLYLPRRYYVIPSTYVVRPFTRFWKSNGYEESFLTNGPDFLIDYL